MSWADSYFSVLWLKSGPGLFVVWIGISYAGNKHKVGEYFWICLLLCMSALYPILSNYSDMIIFHLQLDGYSWNTLYCLFANSSVTVIVLYRLVFSLYVRDGMELKIIWLHFTVHLFQTLILDYGFMNLWILNSWWALQLSYGLNMVTNMSGYSWDISMSRKRWKCGSYYKSYS